MKAFLARKLNLSVTASCTLGSYRHSAHTLQVGMFPRHPAAPTLFGHREMKFAWDAGYYGPTCLFKHVLLHFAIPANASHSALS
jgi:hypothetical protein